MRFAISIPWVTAEWLWLLDPFRHALVDGPQSGSDEQRSQLLPQSQRTARQHAAGRFAMPSCSQFAPLPTRVSRPGKVLCKRGYRTVSRTEVC